MLTPQLTRRLYWVAEAALFVVAVGVLVLIARPDEWEPPLLVGLLLALTLVGERLDLEIRGRRLTASFIPLVLAMSLLGPAPAVAFGLAAMIVQALGRPRSPSVWRCHLSGFAT